MIYNGTNVPAGTTVYDVDANQMLRCVMSVDTDRAVVVCCTDPVQVSAYGDIATYDVKFRSIHPIYGGRLMPDLFHCYGRGA